MLGLFVALACADDTSKDTKKKVDEESQPSSEQASDANNQECKCDRPCLCTHSQWYYLTPPEPRRTLMGYGELALPAAGVNIPETLSSIVNIGIALMGYCRSALYYSYAVVVGVRMLLERLLLTGQVQPYHLAFSQSNEPEFYLLQNAQENTVVNVLAWIAYPESESLDPESLSKYTGMFNHQMGDIDNLLSLTGDIFGEETIDIQKMSCEQGTVLHDYFRKQIQNNVLVISDQGGGVMVAALRGNDGKIRLYFPLLSKVCVLKYTGVAVRTIMKYFCDVIRSDSEQSQSLDLDMVTIPAANKSNSGASEESHAQKQKVDPDPEDRK